MDYLLDTNHWVCLQQNNPSVLTRIQNLPAESTLYMSVINQAELLTGIRLAVSKRRQQELRQMYEQVVAYSVEVLDVTPSIGQYYALVFVALRQKGRPIPTNDIWIAVTARANDLILVSNDEHFQYVESLRLENWVQDTAS